MWVACCLMAVMAMFVPNIDTQDRVDMQQYLWALGSTKSFKIDFLVRGLAFACKLVVVFDWWRQAAGSKYR